MRDDYAREYAELHRRHWWWRAREAIVLREIERLCLPSPIEVLDVGCGAGLLLPQLARWGPVTGIEVDGSLLNDATPFRERIRTEPLGSPVHERGHYGLVTALDVLEHLEHDGRAVDEMLALLAPRGKLLLTVPAFPALWDEHDVINHHHRRYTARSLRELLAPRGQVLRLRYLFHSLFPIKYAMARMNRRRSRAMPQHRIPPALPNRLLEVWCRAEYRGLSWLHLPFGSSVLAVAERRDTAPGRPAR